MADVRGWNLPLTKTTKAWVAGLCGAVLSLLTPLSVVLVDGATLGEVTQGQWISIAIGFIAGGAVTGGATYYVPNNPVEQ